MKNEKELNFEQAYFGLVNENHFGYLILTEYRIIFQFANKLIGDNFNEQFFNVPLCMIQK